MKIGLPQLKLFVSPDCQSIVQEQIKRLQKKRQYIIMQLVLNKVVKEILQAKK